MRCLRGLVLPIVFALVGCSGLGPSPAMQQIVGVSGNHMTLNGVPWLSRGVGLQELVEPSAILAASGDPAKAQAVQVYGTAEFQAIKAFGADTIRFQISQPALDPNNDVAPTAQYPNAVDPYDPTYLSEIVAAVKLARQNGFVVLLAMQDEIPISGETTTHNLATAETQSDWDMLNAAFGKDRGVIFELYNEPHLAATETNWGLWANGDTGTGAVGMQTILTHLRANGSQNVMVLDGLDGAKTLSGVPPITDPLNEVVYAVHPYFDGMNVESTWDADFGVASQTLPVWVDEWSAGSDMAIGLGELNMPPYLSSYQESVDFLNYLSAHSIPLCAGAFDIPNFMVTTVQGWPYTTYDGYSPGTLGDNAGVLVHKLFMNDYGWVPLTAADGL